MTVALAKWTLDEYHRMIDTGLLVDRSVELIRGEIIEMPPEGEPHAYFLSESGDYLAELLGNRAKVRRAHPITLPNQSEPEPDVAIVQRLGREYLDHHPYPENIYWLIEYADTTLEKDLTLKSAVYAESGITEYWVVDIKALTVVVFKALNEGQYSQRTEVSSGTLTPQAFPDLQIPLSALIS